MSTMITRNIEEKLLGMPGCEEANVEIVWDPPWTPQMMSEAARKALGID
jgi:metal-sulfur cluster biosynthetic enzyme